MDVPECLFMVCVWRVVSSSAIQFMMCIGNWFLVRPSEREAKEALSKAPLMSRKTARVLVLLFLFISTWSSNEETALSVPLFCLKPYCDGVRGEFLRVVFSMCPRKSLSNVFKMKEDSVIGLELRGSEWSGLVGLGIKITFADFHVSGMWPRRIDTW